MEKKRLFILVMIVAVATVSACAQVMNEVMLSDLSLEEKLLLRDGKASYYKPQASNEDFELFERVGIGVFGASSFIEGYVHPMAGAKITSDYGGLLKNFIVEGSLAYTRMPFPEESTSPGFYKTYVALGSIGYRLWNNQKRYNYLAIKAGAGLAHHESDSDKKAVQHSSNKGFAASLALSMRLKLKDNFFFVWDVGYLLMPEINHSVGRQTLESSGGNLSLGIIYMMNFS